MRDQVDGDTMHVEFSDPVVQDSGNLLPRIGAEMSDDRLRLALRDAFAEVFSLRLDTERLELFDFNEAREFLEQLDTAQRYPTVIDAENKHLYRPFLQWIGAEFATKYDSGFWSLSVESMIHSNRPSVEVITVGGVRYNDNARMVHRVGGKIVEIFGRSQETARQEHASEQGIDTKLIDYRIDNSGNLGHLALELSRLLGMAE